MPTSYTPLLRLAKPATGELTNTWGTVVNDNITTMVEQAIAGFKSVAMTDADYTLTASNGTSDDSRNMMLVMTGTLTAARNVVCPTASKLYFFKNSTTGGFATTIKTSGGTGIAVPNGSSAIVYCDGTNVVDAVSYLNSLTLAGALAVGGALTVTGAATVGGDLTVDTSTLKVDSTNNRVGVGTASPAYTLDVAGPANVSAVRFPDNSVQSTATSGTAPTLSVVTGTSQAALASYHYVLTNVAATTVTLPAAPVAGEVIWITPANNRTDNVVARNGNNIMGLAQDMTMTNRYANARLRYINSTLGWMLI